MKSPSPFAKQVYDAAAQIPPGNVTTYKILADTINSQSPRAVARALARNPFAPTIPCHRVVSSTLHLAGYKGSSSPSSLALKRKRLESEGVEFDTLGRVLPIHLWNFKTSP